jgi:hypothetical protein
MDGWSMRFALHERGLRSVVRLAIVSLLRRRRSLTVAKAEEKEELTS